MVCTGLVLVTEDEVSDLEAAVVRLLTERFHLSILSEKPDDRQTMAMMVHGRGWREGARSQLLASIRGVCRQVLEAQRVEDF